MGITGAHETLKVRGQPEARPVRRFVRLLVLMKSYECDIG